MLYIDQSSLAVREKTAVSIATDVAVNMILWVVIQCAIATLHSRSTQKLKEE